MNALQCGRGGKSDKVHEVIFIQTISSNIPKSWVLIDTHSTVSVFNNPNMLENIRRTNEKLTLVTNEGKHETDMIGTLKNFGTVWYSPTSLANIMSMSEVRKVCRVTMDTKIEPVITVHRKDGTKMKFQEHKNGLYYYDVPKVNHILDNTFSDYCFVNTVANNKVMFARREVQAAERAREIYALIGRPGQQTFEHIVSNNPILNLPINISDVKRMHVIFGPDIATLKGRLVKQKPSLIPNYEPTIIPDYILKYHGNVTLMADFLRAGNCLPIYKSKKNKIVNCHSCR